MPTDDLTILLKGDVLGRVFAPKAQQEALLDEFERNGLKVGWVDLATSSKVEPIPHLSWLTTMHAVT
jgi:hypothetical protein